MTLHVEPEPCDGILFSLLACSMRDDNPELRRATVEAARTALMEIPDAYLDPRIRDTASAGFAHDPCKDALLLHTAGPVTTNTGLNAEP